jgi:DNA primase
MRMMLQVVMPIETANAAIRAGQFAPFVQKVLADLKPEAAFFTETNGTRSGYIFFDMKDASQLPAIAEPWFLALNATISVRPAMSPQDLGGAAGAAIEAAVTAWPKTLGS